jgi:hypothetical protein
VWLLNRWAITAFHNPILDCNSFRRHALTWHALLCLLLVTASASCPIVILGVILWTRITNVYKMYLSNNRSLHSSPSHPLLTLLLLPLPSISSDSVDSRINTPSLNTLPILFPTHRHDLCTCMCKGWRAWASIGAREPEIVQNIHVPAFPQFQSKSLLVSVTYVWTVAPSRHPSANGWMSWCKMYIIQGEIPIFEWTRKAPRSNWSRYERPVNHWCHISYCLIEKCQH